MRYLYHSGRNAKGEARLLEALLHFLQFLEEFLFILRILHQERHARTERDDKANAAYGHSEKCRANELFALAGADRRGISSPNRRLELPVALMPTPQVTFEGLYLCIHVTRLSTNGWLPAKIAKTVPPSLGNKILIYLISSGAFQVTLNNP